MALNYNPDVLLCLANLSNDEVFTPPNVVNAMLDLLPNDLWSDSKITFLDPCCKSGIFLREIAKRLIKGLEPVIPDLQQRLDHIFHQQLFGIAITELTALLSRRSVYCTKYANSKWSVSHFDTPEGNIAFPQVQHTWDGNRCRYCGASKEVFGERKETHAYALIHNINPEKLFNMKFDVIIGNPPYQLSTNGSVKAQSTPLYDAFVQEAMKLKPRFLSMIIPSRWMNGGFGLDDFRKKMITDKRIHVIHDFFDATSCFNGVSIPGGVCYFLWERNYDGPCGVYSHLENGNMKHSVRYMKEDGLDSFIRDYEAISILKKVRNKKEQSFADIVSQRDPFGLNYYENGKECMFKLYYPNKTENSCRIYHFGWDEHNINYADKKFISTNYDAIHKYKVFISKANGAASANPPYAVISRPFVAKPNTICNMTYLLVGPFEAESEAINVERYIKTKFFRFLVSLLKNTQNAYKKVYTFVPMQDFSKPWTDEELYKKYGLTEEEIAFIESMIRPMEVNLNV